MEAVDGLCVDSDILIDYLRGVERARDFLLGKSREGPLFIGVINVVELYSGSETQDPQKRRRLAAFVENFTALDVTLSIAKLAGQLRRDHRKPFADMIVAATALHHGLALATKNVKHFQAIRGLKLVLPY